MRRRRPAIYIDYGDGKPVRWSRQQVRCLMRHLGLTSITRRQLREATRAWYESIPEMSYELSMKRL